MSDAPGPPSVPEPPDAPAHAKGKGKGFAVAGHQVGPFPAGVWIAVVAVGVGVGVVWRMRRGKVTVSSTTDATPTVVMPAGTSAPSGAVAGAPALAAPEATGPQTNGQWLARALERLVAEGQDPGITQAGLSKFLRGDPLTPQEAAIVKLAIRYFGAPPEGAPAMVVSGPDSSVTPTTPTDLRGLSVGQLLDQGDAAVRAGHGYEGFVSELTRRITVDHSLSINDPALRQASGAPRPVAVNLIPQVLQAMQNAGAHL